MPVGQRDTEKSPSELREQRSLVDLNKSKFSRVAGAKASVGRLGSE